MRTMRTLLIILITSILLTGCQTENHAKELKLSDFIFEANRFGSECSLEAVTPDGEARGNPVLSSEYEYVKNVAARWLNEESASPARTILVSIYHGENESDEVGLFGIEFDSNSSASSAAEFLKQEHPKESGNVIYRENNIVIWLWQEASSTDKCFEKLQDLVEEEIRKAGLDIMKHF